MWILQDDTIIKTPKQLTLAGKTYPAKIFQKPSKLEELGIKELNLTNINQRYYWQGTLLLNRDSTPVVGTYAKSEKDVADLKKDMVRTVKDQVGSRLKATDWMVIREADGGTAMNADVKAYRAAVRTEGDEKESAINDLATLNDVILYENSPHLEVRKIKHTSDEGVETYGPETHEVSREVDLTKHFNAVDPLAEADPAFVSLTAG